MVPHPSQGIQTLLEAEKDAAKIVQQARQYRVQRLKDARSEATKEIEEYRRVKEDEFKAFEASVSMLQSHRVHATYTYHSSFPLHACGDKYAGNISNAQVTVEKETDDKVQSITEVFEAQKDQVLRKLLDRVVLIKPELHRNLKKGSLGGPEEQ
ncbi:V-type ATPase [Pisolithus croceorrhizus]|nr:V-type ATPase [Pisolithus croceorrhizus]